MEALIARGGTSCKGSETTCALQEPAQVANATGREEVANALLRDWATRVDDFHRQIADALGDAWPQKVAVIRLKSDHLRIYSGGFAG